MQNLVLQIPDIFSLIAFIVSVVTIIGLIVTMQIQRNQLKQTKDSQYFEILRKSMSDLYDLYQTESELETKNDCELFAVRLLDILAVLSHLSNQEKIPGEILNFVKFDLEIAKGIMEWFDEKNLNEKYSSTSKEIWSNLHQYITKNQITTCKSELIPEKLRNFDDLK